MSADRNTQRPSRSAMSLMPGSAASRAVMSGMGSRNSRSTRRWSVARRATISSTATKRPPRMRATRSHSSSTSLRIWDEKKIVAPRAWASVQQPKQGALGQRVEPFGRLIENQQVGPVLQALDDVDLLARPRDRRPIGRPQIAFAEFQRVNNLRPVNRRPALQSGEVVEQPVAGGGGVKTGDVRHVAQTATRLQRLAGWAMS